MKGPFAVVGLLTLVLSAGCGTPASPASPTAGAPSEAGQAQGGVATLPLNGRLEGTATVTPLTPPLAFVNVEATGEATILGRFRILLPHTVNFATSTAQGTCTITAANGDTITATFTGQAQVGPVVSIVEQATVTGGTGRFSGATGTLTIRREFTPALGTTTGTVEGTITITHTAGF